MSIGDSLQQLRELCGSSHFFHRFIEWVTLRVKQTIQGPYSRAVCRMLILGALAESLKALWSKILLLFLHSYFENRWETRFWHHDPSYCHSGIVPRWKLKRRRLKEGRINIVSCVKVNSEMENLLIDRRSAYEIALTCSCWEPHFILTCSPS